MSFKAHKRRRQKEKARAVPRGYVGQSMHGAGPCPRCKENDWFPVEDRPISRQWKCGHCGLVGTLESQKVVSERAS